MPNYITIDGGTTNTRIFLVVDGSVTDTRLFSVGARLGREDPTVLQRTIREGITDLLAAHRLTEGDITRILASGMITSEFGLHPLAHRLAPAGPLELHNDMEEVLLPKISRIPFVFMRGVKTEAVGDALVDMMRGEETELMGLFSGAGLYILPGSHSKVVTVDEMGRILDFKTMMTGEMIAALSGYTILKDAVDLTVSVTDEAFLNRGFLAARKQGFNAAVFGTRVLKNLYHANPIECYSYFMGVLLADEIEYILGQDTARIFIGGKQQIKEATAQLLKRYSKAEIIVFSKEAVDRSAVMGAVRIYEHSVQ